MKDKKAALELSTNIIVVVIISIIIVVFGIILTFSVVNTAAGLQKDIEKQTQDYMINARAEGEKLYVHPPQKSGNTYVVGAGVYNEIPGNPNKFKIFIEPEGYFPSPDEKKDILDYVVDYNKDSFTLEQDSYTVKTFLFKLPQGSPKGSYVFNVYACVDNGGVAEQCPQDNDLKKYAVRQVFIDI